MSLYVLNHTRILGEILYSDKRENIIKLSIDSKDVSFCRLIETGLSKKWRLEMGHVGARLLTCANKLCHSARLYDIIYHNHKNIKVSINLLWGISHGLLLIYGFHWGTSSAFVTRLRNSTKSRLLPSGDDPGISLWESDWDFNRIPKGFWSGQGSTPKGMGQRDVLFVVFNWEICDEIDKVDFEAIDMNESPKSGDPTELACRSKETHIICKIPG